MPWFGSYYESFDGYDTDYSSDDEGQAVTFLSSRWHYGKQKQGLVSIQWILSNRGKFVVW